MKIWHFALTLGLLWATPAFSQTGNPPCACCGEEYKQFDFWIGDWVVYANAEMIGFNKITKIESDCVLRENWKSVVSSHSGTSYNFFDQNSKKWKHVWIGSDGKTLEVAGNYKDHKMTMVGTESSDDKGNSILNRITWTANPDGTVRQVWEQSRDGGQSYSVQFDGLYRRRK
jgi:hypothetical protein